MPVVDGEKHESGASQCICLNKGIKVTLSHPCLSYRDAGKAPEKDRGAASITEIATWMLVSALSADQYWLNNPYSSTSGIINYKGFDRPCNMKKTNEDEATHPTEATEETNSVSDEEAWPVDPKVDDHIPELETDTVGIGMFYQTGPLDSRGS